MQAALGLVQDHLVAAPHKEGDCARVGAALDDQHAVLGGAKGHLPHAASPAPAGCGLTSSQRRSSLCLAGQGRPDTAPRPAGHRPGQPVMHGAEHSRAGRGDLPSLSGVSSLKRGTMRAPVAMASSSISTPPTHRTAAQHGRLASQATAARQQPLDHASCQGRAHARVSTCAAGQAPGWQDRCLSRPHRDLLDEGPLCRARPRTRQAVGHEQVVGLVIEAPLADDQRGAAVLAPPDHVGKVLLLRRTQRLKLLH